MDRQRRRLLHGALGLGVSGCAARAPFDPFAALPQPAAPQPFAFGVASGMPQEDRVVIWTRLDDAQLRAAGYSTHQLPVAWEVADDAAFTRIARSGVALASAHSACAVHVEVGGLQAARPYWFRFQTLGATSATGSTRTAPPLWAAAEGLRLVVVAGQQSPATWQALVADAPELVLCLGQAIEADDAQHLRDYRARYAEALRDPAYQTARAACPWLTVTGDAEIARGYAGPDAGSYGRAGADPQTFLPRRAAAYQALWEHTPLRAQDQPEGAQMTLHQRHRWGTLVALHLLDGRQYRDRPPCLDDTAAFACTTSPRRFPAPSLLGRVQEDWLLQGLGAQPLRWNLLAQMQSLLSEQGDADGWSAYPEQRQRLLRQLSTRRVAHPLLFCAGDAVAQAQTLEWRAARRGYFLCELTADAMQISTVRVAADGVTRVTGVVLRAP